MQAVAIKTDKSDKKETAKTENTPQSSDDESGQEGGESGDENPENVETEEKEEKEEKVDSVDDEDEWMAFQKETRKENFLETKSKETHLVHCPHYPTVSRFIALNIHLCNYLFVPRLLDCSRVVLLIAHFCKW